MVSDMIPLDSPPRSTSQSVNIMIVSQRKIVLCIALKIYKIERGSLSLFENARPGSKQKLDRWVFVVFLLEMN